MVELVECCDGVYENQLSLFITLQTILKYREETSNDHKEKHRKGLKIYVPLSGECGGRGEEENSFNFHNYEKGIKPPHLNGILLDVPCTLNCQS